MPMAAWLRLAQRLRLLRRGPSSASARTVPGSGDPSLERATVLGKDPASPTAPRRATGRRLLERAATLLRRSASSPSTTPPGAGARLLQRVAVLLRGPASARARADGGSIHAGFSDATVKVARTEASAVTSNTEASGFVFSSPDAEQLGSKIDALDTKISSYNEKSTTGPKESGWSTEIIKRISYGYCALLVKDFIDRLCEKIRKRLEEHPITDASVDDAIAKWLDDY